MSFQGFAEYNRNKVILYDSYSFHIMNLWFLNFKKAMPSECGSYNSIILATVSFYKYVSLQYCYERTRAQMQRLGNPYTPTFVTCRSVGGETRVGTGGRVSSCSCYTSHEFIERVKGMVFEVITGQILLLPCERNFSNEKIEKP